MQLIWAVALSKWLSSRHIFSDDCALGHMWAFSSNPGLCGDGWTSVNTWYSLSRAEGGQGFVKILYYRALHKALIVIQYYNVKNAFFLYRVHSLISFLLYKMPLCLLILVLELHDSIVFDVASFYFRPPSPLLWFCSSQWESSSWQHCSTMSNSSGTSTRRLLDNTSTKLGYWKTVEMIQGQFQNSSYLQYSMAVWCVLSICHQAIYLSLWFLICGWKLFRGYVVLGPYKIH